MLYKVIIFAAISSLAGIKRPIFGGLAGLLSAAVMSVFFSAFDLPTIVVFSGFGFGFGLVLGRISWWIVHDSSDSQEDAKPYVMPITRGGGSGGRGEIIYTDEEAKNAEDNRRPIR